MKKLLLILPALLLLTACGGGMESEPVNTNTNETIQEEATNVNNETSPETNSEEKINEDQETSPATGEIDASPKETTEESAKEENKREYDCFVPCGKAEADTDGVLSEKECLTICHSGVETCEDKIETGEMEETLFDLCCTGQLIQEIKNRYPDINLDPK